MFIKADIRVAAECGSRLDDLIWSHSVVLMALEMTCQRAAICRGVTEMGSRDLKQRFCGALHFGCFFVLSGELTSRSEKFSVDRPIVTSPRNQTEAIEKTSRLAGRTAN